MGIWVEEPASDGSAGMDASAVVASPKELLGTDHVDGDEPCVKVNGTPLDVTAEEGTLDEVV